MISQQAMLDKVVAKVSADVAESLRDAVKNAVMEAVSRELSAAMTRALFESQFYRQINDDMRNGLQNIFEQISYASMSGPEASAPDANKTKKLFSETQSQIEEIIKTTLEATESIMSAAETLLVEQERGAMLLGALRKELGQNTDLEELITLNAAQEEVLSSIITSLSFQDLTGQRLKKVVSALATIQETVFDLYVSTGLMLKTREDDPDKDIQELAAESKRRVAEIKNSELKGPTSNANQKDVDNLLASLGL